MGRIGNEGRPERGGRDLRGCGLNVYVIMYNIYTENQSLYKKNKRGSISSVSSPPMTGHHQSGGSVSSPPGIVLMQKRGSISLVAFPQ